jgi:hypothetical protein
MYIYTLKLVDGTADWAQNKVGWADEKSTYIVVVICSDGHRRAIHETPWSRTISMVITDYLPCRHSLNAEFR